jgi:curved DNA-binding protein CbpA
LENFYKQLGIQPGASASEIKKAFRKKAKQLHPDITGSENSKVMQELLKAYHALSDLNRRFEIDRAYSAYTKKQNFDYRTWLKEQGDPKSTAKLIFYELMRLEEESAIEIWQKSGGLDFCLEKYMERADWMDCQYILAEELDKRGFSLEAFKLITALLAEENRRPYFNLFTPEIYKYLKSIVKNRLKPFVDKQTWIDCMEALIGIGFSAFDEKTFKESMAKTLKEMRNNQ